MLFVFANRFVGPFLPIVQKWEKNLAIISEVLEEWLSVQRKWLYLEGIFVGGDIRHQLPEEAKKFDSIDASYRKVIFSCFHFDTILFFFELEFIIIYFVIGRS